MTSTFMWKPWPEMRAGCLLLVMAVLLAGCGRREEKKSDSAASDTAITPALPDGLADSSVSAVDSALAPPVAAEWTAGIVDLAGEAFLSNDTPPGGEIAVLSCVRHAAHDDYDRIVFEFTPEARPPVHVEYIDRPVRSCGSGEVVPLAGDAWLLVKFTPAVAHTEEGHPTVGDRARSPNLSILKELKLICDFEADVSWVAGVSSPQRYRAFALMDPPRVVVDIGHQ